MTRTRFKEASRVRDEQPTVNASGKRKSEKASELLSRVRSNDRLAALEEIAFHLNLGPAVPGPHGIAWQRAADVMGMLVFTPATGRDGGTLLTKPPSFPLRRSATLDGLARRTFNRLARRVPVYLELGRVGASAGQARAFRPRLKAHSADGEMLIALWESAFSAGAIRRLKRCDLCARWFVDRADNTAGRWCGRRCKDRWWTRGRRRAEVVGRRRRRRAGRGRPE